MIPAILALVPVLGGLAAFGVGMMMSGHDNHVVDGLMSISRPVLPLIAAGLLARRFKPGEHQRLVWRDIFFAYVMLLVLRLLTEWPLVDVLPTSAGFPMRLMCITAINILWVIATQRFAATWSVASLPMPAKSRILVAGISLVCAIAIGGGAAYLDWSAGRRFDEWTALMAISTVGDVIAMAYFGPLLTMAIRLRGGAFSVPVLLFSGTLLTAFGIDLCIIVQRLLNLMDSPAWTVGQNAFGMASDLYVLVAALAVIHMQRMIERSASTP